MPDLPVMPLETRLETERCYLRALRLSDAPTVHYAAQAPGFKEGLGWQNVATLKGVQARIARDVAGWQQGNRYAFAAERKQDAHLVSGVMLSYLPDEPEPSSWLLAYWTHPEHQRQGYAVEAARAVLTFAFTRLNATVIWAGSAVFNTASRKVLEKLEFTWSQRNPSGYSVGDKVTETDEFFLRRDAWEKREHTRNHT